MFEMLVHIYPSQLQTRSGLLFAQKQLLTIPGAGIGLRRDLRFKCTVTCTAFSMLS